MRVLIGKTFGIGNAVMAIPMIKALQYKSDTVVDVLVGNTPDDVGAIQVLSKVVKHPGKLFVNSALEHDYDVAIMAIPFDGRWQQGVHFRAKEVLDGRTRPDPSTTGLVSWKRHEIDYQMENARSLGFHDFDPDTSFLAPCQKENKIYLGVGYKKDAAGFWKIKHWGNENYAELVKLILKRMPSWKVVSTGDAADLQLSLAPISRLIGDSRFEIKVSSDLDSSFREVASSRVYVGNDTGMMHVAASAGCDVLGLFFLGNSVVKSSPRGLRSTEMFSQEISALDFSEDRSKCTPLVVMTHLEMMLN